MHKDILIVEDNEDDLILTQRALKKNNVLNNIIIARDGQEALDLIYPVEGKKKLDLALLLTDLNMPRLGGLDLLKRLQQDPDFLHIPKVILTTSDEEDDMVKGYANGASSFVRKPVDFHQFSEKVKQLGIYWLMVNETIRK